MHRAQLLKSEYFLVFCIFCDMNLTSLGLSHQKTYFRMFLFLFYQMINPKLWSLMKLNTICSYRYGHNTPLHFCLSDNIELQAWEKILLHHPLTYLHFTDFNSSKLYLLIKTTVSKVKNELSWTLDVAVLDRCYLRQSHIAFSHRCERAWGMVSLWTDGSWTVIC